MTEQTAAAGTDVVQVASGALALVQGRDPWTVIQLADMIGAPAPAVPADEPMPAVAAPVKFTDSLRNALKTLPGVFGKIMPTERRKLEAAELVALTDEAVTIDALIKELGERRKAISEFVRTHQDFEAQDNGLITSETTRIADGVAKGHFLIAQPQSPFTTCVDGYKKGWQQRFVKGGTDIRGGDLDELLTAGEIDRKTYLACTTEVRVFDPMKLTEYIRKNPVKGLQLLKRITHRKPPSASLYAPEK